MLACVSNENMIQLQAYALVLALGTVATSNARARRSIKHLCFLLIVIWLAIAYRDLWPLATFTLIPIDKGSLMWVEIGVVSFAAAVIPLLVPRQYVPYDPKVRST